MTGEGGGPDLDRQRAHYDERWRSVGHASLPQLGRAIAILEGLQAVEQKDPQILDLGCGTGWLAGILGRFGPTTGVDLSPGAIGRAMERHPDVRFLCGDLFTLSLPPEGFDVVVSVQVIEHVEDPARFVNLAADLLRPGGHLLLITDNPRNLRRWRREALADYAGMPQPIQRQLTREQLAALLAPRFHIERQRTLLAGYGDRGILRLAHSVKLGKALRTLGLLDVFHRGLLRAGLGLVAFVHARRR